MLFCSEIHSVFFSKQDAFFLGLDIDESQLVKADQNVEFAKFGDRVQLLQASSKGRNANPLHMSYCEVCCL